MFNAFLVAGLLMLFGIGGMAGAILGMMFWQRTQTKQMLAYLDSIERYCQSFNEDVQRMDAMGGWESGDGRPPNQLDDLLKQMKRKDGYNSDDEVNNFIKDINSESEWRDEDHGEEEDSEDEPFM